MSKTPSSETPTSPDLSIPSFSSDLPKEWQELTEYALEEEEKEEEEEEEEEEEKEEEEKEEEEEGEEEPQTVIKKLVQSHQQVITETTSDIMELIDPQLPKKSLVKFFIPQYLLKKKQLFNPFLLQQQHPL